jgi:hypothetical protein
VADLEEIGLPLAAAAAIAGYFGKVDASSMEPEAEQPEPEPERKEPQPQVLEPEPGSPSGPMAEFDEAAVLAWVTAVPVLTAAQRAAALERMEEDEYDGGELAMAKAKSLLRLLRGTAAAAAVPRLLAARDAHLEAEEAAAAAVAVDPEPAAAEWPSCAICMEAYSAAGGFVPRVLPCGHDFCEKCLDRILRCAGPKRASSRRL